MLKAQSFLVSLALMCWLALSPWAVAQSLPTLQDHTKDQDQNQDQSVETLKVQVNVVQLFFNVKDKKGGLIPDQKKEDFELSEDGKPQTIKYFTAESNLPLTLGILIDTSGSQMRVLEMEKEVGGAFLNEILRDKDEAFVISFDVNVDLLQDFTNDKSPSERCTRIRPESTPDRAEASPVWVGHPAPANPRRHACV